MMKIEDIQKEGRGLTIEYDIKHSTPGDTGTTLSLPLILTVTPEGSECRMNIEDCEGKTPDECLNKMTTWLKRIAEAIENRKESISFPVN